MRALEIRKVSLSFGGLQAVRELDLTLRPAGVFALSGANGAGKTSVFNLITQVLKPTSGSIFYGDTDLCRLARHEVAREGIARTFQTTELLGHATVMDHLLLGCHRYAKAGFLSQCLDLPSARRTREEAADQAGTILSLLGLNTKADRTVAELSQGDRRLVEVGRALATRPTLLLLDEPAAGLNAEQIRLLVACLGQLCAMNGMSVLMIEHNIALVAAFCDKVFVMREGMLVREGAPKDVFAHLEASP